MGKWILQVTALLGILACPLSGQDAVVRPVQKVSMPIGVDSNSPAFWRDGKLFWFGSHGRPWLNEGTDQFGPWITHDVNVETTNAFPHWLESVHVDDSAVLWGWYHGEPVGLLPDSTMTAPKIGAVVSFDGGRTLRDIGIVLESGDPLNPSAQNGYFAGGHGDFSVILDRTRTYFYFFFDNYGGAAETQGVCLARMAFEDRFNPEGKVWKYYNGAWQEAGRGGRVTPIMPVRKPWGASDPDAFWGPSVHWNTHLRCYVMLLNRASGEPGWSQEGVYISFATDLNRPESWSPPRKILDKSQFSGWYFFYPQVMGLEPGGTDRQAGKTARLYVNGISKWEIDFTAPPSAPLDVEVSASTPLSPILAGMETTLTATAAGEGPFTYQWFKDGAMIPAATSATYHIATATLDHSGIYSVSVTNAIGTTTSAGMPVVVLAPVAQPEAFLSNLSVRSWLPSEEAMLTLGFVVEGAGPKPLAVRAVGQSLAAFGVADGVADPRLEIFDGAAVRIAENDNWLSADAEPFAATGAFPLPEGSTDAALLVEVLSGAGTAQAQGTGAGVALVEIYDPAASPHSKFINLSARAPVGAGDEVLIGGFNLSGTGSKRFLIRAVGPQLESFGVSNALADPMLEVYEDGTPIAGNDDWAAELAPVFAESGASTLTAGSRDAAVVVTLAAGSSYTVVVRSASGSAGEALLEIYELP